MITTNKSLLRGASFIGIFGMEGIFPHKIRRKAYFFIKNTTLIIGLIYTVVFLTGANTALESQLLGGFMIFLSLTMVLFSLEAFFASYYGRNESEIISGSIIHCAGDDLLSSFIFSPFGQRVILRTEIPINIITNLLEKRGDAEVIVDVVSTDPSKEILNAKELALAIFEADQGFKKLLSSYGIDKKIFSNILDWVITDMEKEYRREAWWWREYLVKIPGIGKDWNFGRLYYLVKYGKDLAPEAVAPSIDFDIKEFGTEVGQLESILSKGRESNALLVGEPGAGVMDMVSEFVRKLDRGKIHPALEYKRVFILNWNNLVAANKDKTGLETELLNVLNEALQAGNIILVMEDFPGFMVSAGALGVNVQSILDPYLESQLQILATTDNHKFHQLIEKNPDLMRRFNQVSIEETDEEKTIEIIKNTVRKIEKTKGLFFSYPAIKEIVTGATQYFPGNVMPDGAIDILFEIIGSSLRKSDYITRNDVLNFIEMKTKIPLGKMESTEKDKLLNLESILHERIIGQEEAVSVISNAMRRTRADIRNSKKPIGTFLFLGPTGVGKTETAKALASVFFGEERFMLRLDMTEYQKSDSLQRLIGSFENGKSGVLSSMLRENPYGVLLLDEFEKAEKDVQNLFLQILDEGFFSDMDGKKVSLRNVIIIATSNAASDYIFQLIKENKDLIGQKDSIVNKIVDTGVFKPELINRFDATVIFHPLDKSELFQIAKIMLNKLKKRLTGKGINFVVTDELAMAVATEGANDIFGARPMNRYIQDKVEQSIARKMISGELVGGDKIELRPIDL
ncbi:MAG: clp protease ATP binding subunit [Parcubacteria group bacterium GW2011_GWF2_38_76]|nr:MAG: clp protease ATP binding subunit [Parcubacteria group bacterium GW2011_GWF2_38_76]